MTICTLTSPNTGCLRSELTDGLEGIPFDEGRPHRTVQLCRKMEDDTRCILIGLLQEYQDVFTFGTEEMSGISPAVIEHQLNIDPPNKPMAQKKGHIGSERAATMTAEV